MSLEIRFWNLVVLKKKLESKYPGGIEQFKQDYPDKPYQEDEFLISFSFMNGYDIDYYINALAEKGLDYDRKKEESKDFVVLAFEINGGLWWKVDWLEFDLDNCWYNQNYQETTPEFKDENSPNVIHNKSLSQSSLINELRNSIDYISDFTYENFISAFNLSKSSYGILTLFETKISTLFLLDYFIVSKSLSKEFRDNLFHVCHSKIKNEFSGKLNNQNLDDIIEIRYISYARIPGMALPNWELSFLKLLEINLKGTKNIINARTDYPSTLEDGDMHLQKNIIFIDQETLNFYRYLRLIDEILDGACFEDARIVVENLESNTPNRKDKSKKEGCYVATMVYGDYDSREVQVLRDYRDTKLKKILFGNFIIKVYYLFSPFFVNQLKHRKKINLAIKYLLDYIVKYLYNKKFGRSVY